MENQFCDGLILISFPHLSLFEKKLFFRVNAAPKKAAPQHLSIYTNTSFEGFTELSIFNTRDLFACKE
jgi:hypothetical protein